MKTYYMDGYITYAASWVVELPDDVDPEQAIYNTGPSDITLNQIVDVEAENYVPIEEAEEEDWD